jgi:hypothetical protein
MFLSGCLSSDVLSRLPVLVYAFHSLSGLAAV